MTSPADRPHLAEGLLPPRSRVRDSSAFATLMLVLLTAVWGFSFSLMKAWQDAAARIPPCAGTYRALLLSTLTMIFVRFGLAAALLGSVRPDLVRRPTRRAYRVGAMLGVIFLLAFVMQVAALAVLSPARSAFLANLSALWIPLLAWAWLGTRPTGGLVVGLGLGLTGAAVLTGSGAGAEAPFNWGDLLTVASAFFFGLMVVVLDRHGRDEPSHHFTIGFLLTTTLLAAAATFVVVAATPGVTVAGWAGWLAELLGEPNMPWVLAGMVGTTALSFHLMSSYQPRVGATRAGLIYLMEIVFGALFSILLGYDELSTTLLVSGALILGGNLVVELPGWRRAKSRRAPSPAGADS